jgi:hypothetical protein
MARLKSRMKPSVAKSEMLKKPDPEAIAPAEANVD